MLKHIKNILLKNISYGHFLLKIGGFACLLLIYIKFWDILNISETLIEISRDIVVYISFFYIIKLIFDFLPANIRIVEKNKELTNIFFMKRAWDYFFKKASRITGVETINIFSNNTNTYNLGGNIIVGSGAILFVGGVVLGQYLPPNSIFPENFFGGNILESTKLVLDSKAEQSILVEDFNSTNERFKNQQNVIVFQERLKGDISFIEKNSIIRESSIFKSVSQNTNIVQKFSQEFKNLEQTDITVDNALKSFIKTEVDKAIDEAIDSKLKQHSLFTDILKKK